MSRFGTWILLAVVVFAASWYGHSLEIREDMWSVYDRPNGFQRVFEFVALPGWIVALISLPDRGSDRGPDPTTATWIVIPVATCFWLLVAGAAAAVWRRLRGTSPA